MAAQYCAHYTKTHLYDDLGWMEFNNLPPYCTQSGASGDNTFGKYMYIDFIMFQMMDVRVINNYTDVVTFQD